MSHGEVVREAQRRFRRELGRGLIGDQQHKICKGERYDVEPIQKLEMETEARPR